MTTYIIRASHANQYELQNYEPISKECDIKLVTSRHPLTTTKIPTIKLWSPTDLPTFPFRKQILNRLIGGEQWLLSLDSLVSQGDILHTAETYTPYTHQAVKLRRANKIKKLVCTCWETIPHNNEKFLRLREWKKEAYQYVDIFHTPTERAKEALIVEGVNPKKIKVINYGVDLNHFKPSTKRVVSSKPIVLTVARKVREKGIDIWNQLRQEFGSSIDFRWVDSLPYKAVIKEYQKADVFLLPSMTTETWEEQYGMVLIEAMASGLPIVTTTSGAIPEVVADATLTSDVQDVESHINNIKSLIHDNERYAEYASMSIKRAQMYDSKKVAVKLATLYRL